ncbi:endogenous retrovirus group K member 25 Env polyprotein-like [Oryctolagus cuniculus]|uniref:endogenous retrovirus group K member 25 Env polyprotein-like n=1 Tax=Oryctolagus cuniculus TaxID=9986 RepID=UPI003879428A
MFLYSRWLPERLVQQTMSQSSPSIFIITLLIGIVTAAIITAISVAAVGATTAAIALTGTVQTANTLNNLMASVAAALDTQTSLNVHIKGGLMIVNQRVDLVQEQVDTLWQLAQLGCEWKFSGLCVTSVQYDNMTQAANYSKQLSQMLLQNWSAEFDYTLEQLRLAVVTINSTRVDVSFTSGLSSWICTAVSNLKEWVGLGALTGCCYLLCYFACGVCAG